VTTFITIVQDQRLPVRGHTKLDEEIDRLCPPASTAVVGGCIHGIKAAGHLPPLVLCPLILQVTKTECLDSGKYRKWRYDLKHAPAGVLHDFAGHQIFPHKDNGLGTHWECCTVLLGAVGSDPDERKNKNRAHTLGSSAHPRLDWASYLGYLGGNLGKGLTRKDKKSRWK
jgi:hypothetical protein